MTTDSRLHANRQNATHSTGPLTEAGKAASSRNALTMGLYTRSDYVKPEERDLYKEFCETMYDQLNPAGLLEESFVSEITGATWRLRRCSNVEGELADYAPCDPMLDELFEDGTARPYPHEGSAQTAAFGREKTRRSIERARAAAHSLLHRSINQLRKLQTERATREQIQASTRVAPLAESRKVSQACNAHLRTANRTEKVQADAVADSLDAALASIMNCPEPDWAAIDLDIAREREAEAKMGSNCEPAQTAAQPNPFQPVHISENDPMRSRGTAPGLQKAA